MGIGFSTFVSRTRVLGLIVVVGGGGVCAGAGPAALSPGEQYFRSAVADLKSGDAAKIDKVENRIRNDAKAGNANGDEMRVLDAMTNLGMGKEAARICLDGLIASPSGNDIDDLLVTRVHALVRDGQRDEALSAAKMFYDAASLERTADAIRAVTLCLSLDEKDKGLASRFKRQQLAWAAIPTTQPEVMHQATTREGEELGEPILAGIEVDGAPFVKRLGTFQPVDWGGFLFKGNLLLLADHPTEAREAFGHALDLADDDNGRLTATEGIARSIRAQSGCVGPANAYLRSVRNEK